MIGCSDSLIASLIEQGARIDTFGVGTRLVTCYDQPALGGVYKLGAMRDADGAWRDVIKLSEQPIKISNPGHLAVRRFRQAGALVADVIYDRAHGLTRPPALHDLDDPTRTIAIDASDADDDLLSCAIERGARVRTPDTLVEARARAAAEVAALSPRTRRFLNPQPYAVGLDTYVHEHKLAMIAAARSQK